MRLDKLTQRSQELALSYNHSQLEPEHLLLALLEQDEGLAEQGSDPSFVARPLKRITQRYISQPPSNEILKGKFKEGDKIKVDLKDEEIIFSKTG